MVLPEYGRVVHELAEQCVSIEDREERNAFANAIIELMRMAVQDKAKEGDEKKYWDHLYLITGGLLDVDYPFGTPSVELIKTRPRKIPYNNSHLEKRQYGKVVQNMVRAIAKMENGEEKDFFVDLLANHVKKLQTLHNPESASDEHVFADIAEMSKGNIVLSSDFITLLDFKEERPVKNQKKKKGH